MPRGPRARAGLATLLGLVCCAAGAHAAPPDLRLALKKGTPRIEKLLGDFDAVLVEPPQVAHAELLPTGELLIEPLMQGEALVFAFQKRQARVFEIAVDQPLPAAAPAPAAPCEKPHIEKACYAPWAKRLLHVTPAEMPQLVFEVEGMQEQARVAQARLTEAKLGHVQVSFSAFGVRVKGHKSEDERRRAIVAIYPAMLGSLRIDE